MVAYCGYMLLFYFSEYFQNVLLFSMYAFMNYIVNKSCLLIGVLLFYFLSLIMSAMFHSCSLVPYSVVFILIANICHLCICKLLGVYIPISLKNESKKISCVALIYFKEISYRYNIQTNGIWSLTTT